MRRENSKKHKIKGEDITERLIEQSGKKIAANLKMKKTSYIEVV